LEFDFKKHLERQSEWSEKIFGPGDRTKGIVDHIRKELIEVEAKPNDLSEWMDIVILALDGAWRQGASPDDIISRFIWRNPAGAKRRAAALSRALEVRLQKHQVDR